MKTTCLHLQKGGVGKTSLSGAIAWELAQKGKTILVDVDPQGNTSSWFLTSPSKYELADVLQGRVELEKVIVKVGSLSIIPTFGIDGELKMYGESKLADEPYVFCDLIEELKNFGYDYIILDLSPGIGRLEKSALLCADEVITPMTPDEFSLDGIEIFSNELKKLCKAFRREIQHKKIIINAYDARIKQHHEILPKVKAAKGFEAYIVPVDPAFRKAQAMHIPLQELKGDSAMKSETAQAIKTIVEGI